MADEKKRPQKPEYYPIVKWKAGEYRALAALTNDVKDAIIPLAEIVPVPFDFERGIDKKTTEKHVDDAIEAMKKHWGARPIFVDVHLLPPGTKVKAKPVLTHVLELARTESLHAIPTVSTRAAAADIKAAGDGHRKDGHGVCLRERVDDVLAPGFAATLNATVLSVGVPKSEIDLIVDMQDVSDGKLVLAKNVAEHALRAVPDVAQWRSIALAATAFPINLSGIAPGVALLPRADWKLWRSLAGLPRTPIFADYTIAHWDLAALDPRVIKISASVRYTHDDDWVIFRGRNVNAHGFGQFTTLSKQIVKHPAFKGAAFSYGDDYIAACASGGPTGNHETWRRVGANHHITFVVRQIASLSATSTRLGRASGAGKP
jgi:hypothetical protein